MNAETKVCLDRIISSVPLDVMDSAEKFSRQRALDLFRGDGASRLEAQYLSAALSLGIMVVLEQILATGEKR